jgi:hypothetical protein
MKAVYGRKRLAASSQERETWMDQFTQLEPEDGFRAAAKMAWSRTVASHYGASRPDSIDGGSTMKPVYGRNGSPATARIRGTFMDRFTQLETTGGFREAARRVWNVNAREHDQRLAPLAA